MWCFSGSSLEKGHTVDDAVWYWFTLPLFAGHHLL
ncbi:hypothetical protein T03_2523 [Trichinella britovi]|uniref:Uncharacterized protein n=1 Tax=Trichinella britovi TaxID=45882 RepID=A0A0V0YSL3_TRIBR|nr:hypothetical protein T03_2523 [Trichinella britovi]